VDDTRIFDVTFSTEYIVTVEAEPDDDEETVVRKAREKAEDGANYVDKLGVNLMIGEVLSVEPWID
jgi:hypothetical protein